MEQIRIGVVGAGRGMDIAQYFMMQDCKVVALCDLGLRKFNNLQNMELLRGWWQKLRTRLSGSKDNFLRLNFKLTPRFRY